MNKQNIYKLKAIKYLFKLFFILTIFLHLICPTLANPEKIIKNVICKEKSTFKNFLENTQNEYLLWLGLSEDGSTITELYVSKETNSWTILETGTNGISCATIGGKNSIILNNN
ncbi:MAG: hypothetical protein CMJ12_01285 [Pelagibacterales bacterium]|nr:hypothetical protein [Pelagibacterales bacterium]PPR15804.1 MAG: hypothetical protein CFH33_01179 [Alphaproteobacteria bacterium MarineAlpha9_Bin3]|tara:strand:+ start:80 stop:421 length:342 start_codon:yes stop_codon:yes gene_type:complete